MTDDGAGRPKPIERPIPTAATIKQLYATAFRCAAPSCMKPLYRVSDTTGKFILNSRVAHIHARSEGGPRWDPTMSGEDNRSAANLMLMCEEHAFEIDTTPDDFPADLLREWKAAQLAEYLDLQKSWPINDDEAAEVAHESFDARAFGVATASAATVLAAARAVGLLIETCRQGRRVPDRLAAAWRAWRAQVNRSMPVWDADGNRLHVEPPMVQTREREAELVQALDDAVAAVEPIAVTVVAELHAVRAADEALTRWCDWVETATAAVLAAVGRWPGNPPLEDDDELPDAIAEVQRASGALSAAWRNEPAAEPPEPQPLAPETVETEQQRLLREHRELLEMARPWARSQRRPYDADLCARIMGQAVLYAAEIPPVPSFLPIDLERTAGLAADLARNADDATYQALIVKAAHQRPLSVAVNLVRQFMFTARKAQRDELATEASELAIQLLRDADWQEQQTWLKNHLHTRALLGWTASVTSDDDVRATVAAAITNDAQLLPLILHGIAQWVENRDRNTWHVIGISNGISELPPWFPTEQIVREIESQMPELAPAESDEADSQDTDTQHLAAHVLRLASQKSHGKGAASR